MENSWKWQEVLSNKYFVVDEDKNGEGNNLLVLKREGGEFEDEEGEDLKIMRKLSCFVVESIC